LAFEIARAMIVPIATAPKTAATTLRIIIVVSFVFAGALEDITEDVEAIVDDDDDDNGHKAPKAKALEN
jgi:hypothetical protein